MGYIVIPYDNQNADMLPHDEEPFDVIGRLVPVYDGSRWHMKEELLAESGVKTYPNEAYDPSVYIGSENEAAFLAVLSGKRVGSIRMCRRWNGMGFIDDLKVDRACRRLGIGKSLMDAAVKWCKEKNLNGVSLETQDNNLIACRFYIKYGFRLGGIDTRVYTDSAYKNETALYFYLSEEVYKR